MFDELANSLIQESFRPIRAKERLAQMRSTPYGAFNAALLTKKKDPEVESRLLQIAKNTPTSTLLASELVKYAKIVMKERWPEAEPYILRSPYASMWYAAEVIKDRWPEAEVKIKDNARLSSQYARNVIKGRFEAGEPTILENPYEIVEYAIHVVGDRWPEAEPILKADNKAPWLEYKYYFGIEEED